MSLQSPTFQPASVIGGVFTVAAFPNVSITTPNPRLRRSTAREGVLQQPSLQSPSRSTDGGASLPTSVAPPTAKSTSVDPTHSHNVEGTVGTAASSKAKGNNPSDSTGPVAIREGERTGTADLKGSLNLGSTSMAMNIGLIAGISVGVLVLLLVLSCAVYKWRSREEGTYSLEAAAANDYGYEACLGGTVYDAGGGDRRLRPSKTDGQTTKTKKRQTKEWYV